MYFLSNLKQIYWCAYCHLILFQTSMGTGVQTAQIATHRIYFVYRPMHPYLLSVTAMITVQCWHLSYLYLYSACYRGSHWISGEQAGLLWQVWKDRMCVPPTIFFLGFLFSSLLFQYSITSRWEITGFKVKRSAHEASHIIGVGSLNLRYWMKSKPFLV